MMLQGTSLLFHANADAKIVQIVATNCQKLAFLLMFFAMTLCFVIRGQWVRIPPPAPFLKHLQASFLPGDANRTLISVKFGSRLPKGGIL